MQRWMISGSAGALVALAVALPGAAIGRAEAQQLAPVSAFDGIADQAERSRALFAEAGKVITASALRQLPPGGRPAAAGR